MTLGDFARKRKYLFWSTKNYDGLSPEAVLEGVLNYGDMNDVKKRWWNLVWRGKRLIRN